MHVVKYVLKKCKSDVGRILFACRKIRVHADRVTINKDFKKIVFVVSRDIVTRMKER